MAGRAIAAIAGTASPANFFNAIKRTGLQVACYPLADHAPLTQETLSRMPESFVVMTEKDAVKWPKERKKVAWVAVRDTQLDPKFITWLLGQINPKKG